MGKRITQLTIGALVAVIALTGLATFSPVSSNQFGSQEVAACSKSKFRVNYRTGVRKYRDINSSLIGYLNAGAIVYGPTGGTSGGMTKINYTDAQYHTTTGYLRQDARTYLGCS